MTEAEIDHNVIAQAEDDSAWEVPIQIRKTTPMTEYYPADMLFEVLTPLGFWVHVTRRYWQLIVSIKHPVMLGQEDKVQQVLANPEEIRVSRSDPAVYLFYATEQWGRWVCAVAKRENDEGFLITAYPTDAIKEGVRIWPK